MEVILLEKIHNLGNLGESVKVKGGYGRNYLIPQGKAVLATPENLKRFEEKRATLEKKASDELKIAQERVQKLSALTVKIPAMVGDEGKLFGSIGTRDIAEAVTKAGVSLKKSEVLLPHGVLRYAGEFDIDLLLHSDIKTTIKVHIVSEA